MANKVVYRGETYFRDNESFAIVRVKEGPKARAVFHTHDFVEICYVGSGNGYHVVGGEKHRVSKGDLFLINYDMTHAFYRNENDEELVTYNILFKPGFLDERLISFHDFSSLTMSYLFRDNWDDQALRADLRLGAEEQREIDQLIVKMHNEYTRRYDGHYMMLRAHMIELIVRMLRSFSGKSAGDGEQRRKATAIEAALRHLETFYYEPISLNELAKKSFFSKNYFAQLFKEKTGMTVSQYTQQVRIDEACRLIRSTDKSWMHVAAEVGYADYKAFYVAFKKQRGVSPNEYAKQSMK